MIFHQKYIAYAFSFVHLPPTGHRPPSKTPGSVGWLGREKKLENDDDEGLADF